MKSITKVKHHYIIHKSDDNLQTKYTLQCNIM